jgi:hypothetical protein
MNTQQNKIFDTKDAGFSSPASFRLFNCQTYEINEHSEVVIFGRKSLLPIMKKVVRN